jgi:hypothetical protein
VSAGSLLTQSVITAGGLATLVFLAAGFVARGIQLKYAPGEGETRSLAFLAPALLGG